MSSNKQSTSHVFMIEPVNFHSNTQTLATNKHQIASMHKQPKQISSIQQQALQEHQKFRKLLESENTTITFVQGKPETPDDIFCNNWVSTHANGTYNLYPMMAPNRRIERRKDIIAQLEKHYKLHNDFSPAEQNKQFLESTGSLVLDRVNKIAYAVRSPRTNEQLVHEWCKRMEYEPIIFNCFSPEGIAEYHTNVIMFIGTNIATLYTYGIPAEQRTTIINKLQQTHTVIKLTYSQVQSFCGNTLEICSNDGKLNLVMSSKAYNAFTPAQQQYLAQAYNKLIYTDLSTIETYGGGSARCLLLELF